MFCLLLGVSVCHRPNRPPARPDVPAGPASGKIYVNYTYATRAIDPDGDSVSYQFDWGNGQLSDWSPFRPGVSTYALAKHWYQNADYTIRARAKDTHEAISEWSEGLILSIGNLAPTTPQFLYAPDTLWPGMTDSIVVLSYDFDLDSFNYLIDWGDSSGEDTSDLTFSGGIRTFRHEWLNTGTFAVRVRARDLREALSDWSEVRAVQVPGPRLLWRVYVGSAPSSPAISLDGTVYVTAGGRLHALNPDSSVKWSYGSGLAASPVSVSLKNNCYLLPNSSNVDVLDADGARKWTGHFDGAGSSSQIRVPALGVNGISYLRADALYAYDANGALLWRSDDGGAKASAAAVATDGTAYYQSDTRNMVYALNPDSSVRWAAAFPPASAYCPPAIGAGGTVYCYGRYGTLAAFDPDGRQLWQLTLEGTSTPNPPAIGPDGVLYCCGDDGLSAVHPDGTLKWTFPTRRPAEITPAVTADSTVIFGSDDRSLLGLSPDGTIRWGRGTGGRVRTSPAVGPDGVIYFCSDDGFLYALAGASPLADSPWPMFHHDPQHTGRAR